MTKRDLENEILFLLQQTNPMPVKDRNASLFGRTNHFAANDLFFVIMEIEKEHKINIELAISQINEYTIEQLVDTLYFQIEGNAKAY